ncbi:MAG TPA: hypothetical protein VNN73_16730 [Blastocatellia bacterium]|nr:hypothetical protein [Blastocatellia bacterium]
MAILLIILATVFVCGLALHGYKQYKIRVLHRMSENEYSVAVTLWEYACVVKESISVAIRKSGGLLEFEKIAVPHSHGYTLSLELIGTYFRVHAVPVKYNKTGRLSFLADNTLTVRAADHFGKQASPDDPEYKGNAGE